MLKQIHLIVYLFWGSIQLIPCCNVSTAQKRQECDFGGSEENGSPVGYPVKQEVIRTSHPKQAVRLLQKSNATIEDAGPFSVTVFEENVTECLSLCHCSCRLFSSISAS